MSHNHPPTVPFVWYNGKTRLGPAAVLREWLDFIQTTAGLLS